MGFQDLPGYQRVCERAKNLIADPKKGSRYVDEASHRFSPRKYVGEAWDAFRLLLDYAKDTLTGRFKADPKCLLAVLVAIIYVASPFDFIPDFIPGIGFADDAALIMGVFAMVAADIERYKEWRAANRKKEKVHKMKSAVARKAKRTFHRTNSGPEVINFTAESFGAVAQDASLDLSTTDEGKTVLSEEVDPRDTTLKQRMRTLGMVALVAVRIKKRKIPWRGLRGLRTENKTENKEKA